MARLAVSCARMWPAPEVGLAVARRTNPINRPDDPVLTRLDTGA